MTQTLVPPDRLRNDRFSLRGSEAHHLVRVLRVREGDPIDIFDGQGARYQAVVTRVEPTEPFLEGRLVKKDVDVPSCLRLRLFQGLPRGSKFDYVLEKATELGADEIFPFLSEKSVVRVDASAAKSKLRRWQRLVEAAAKQCDRATIPTVRAPQSLLRLDKELGDDVTLVFSLSEALPIRQRIEEIRAAKRSTVNIVVGPESGFSGKELSWLTEMGGRPTALGNLTLRTETAGLAALSILRYELDVIGT